MIFVYQEYVIFIRVIDHFIQIYNIRMIQCLENLQLLQETQVRLLLFQFFLAHLLDGILSVGRGKCAQVDCGEGPFSQGSLNPILVYHLFSSLILVFIFLKS